MWNRIGFIATVLFVLALPHTAKADIAPVAVDLCLQNSIIMQGEPLILVYRFRNSAAEAVTFVWENEPDGWLTIQTCAASGQVLSTPSDHDVNRREGTNWDAGQHVPPGDAIGGSKVIPQGSLPTGNYVLLVNIHAPYRVGETTGLGDQKMFTDERKLAFRVLPRNDEQFQLIMAQLAATAKNDGGQPVAKTDTAIKALFSMQDALASPVWKQLLWDPKFNDSGRLVAIEALRSHGTRIAADLLEQIWADQRQPLMIRETAKSSLFSLAMHDSALKQYATEILERHGVQLPKSPTHTVFGAR